MSFEALSWAIDLDIKAPHKSVLLMLAYRDNPDDWGCYPSLEKIAFDCGLDRSSVTRSVKWLLARRYIKRRARFNEDGRQTSSFYSFPSVKRGRGANSTTGGAGRAGRGANSTGGRGANSTTESKDLEPKLESKGNIFCFECQNQVNGKTFQRCTEQGICTWRRDRKSA